MKKRIPAIILTLALCIGLAVPAFAADVTVTISIRYPHYTTKEKAVTRTYQTRGTTMSSPDTIVYKETEEEYFTVGLLPLGADFTVGGLPLGETIGFGVWMDEDGDGVYEHRPLLVSPEDGSVSIAPFAESYTSAGGTDYVRMSEAETFGFDVARDENGAMKCPSDRLYEMFGANTILDVYWVAEDGEDGGLMYTFLLTGKDVPEPAVAFTDVSAGAWYIDPVAWAVDEKITQGTGGNKFSPGKDCTHEQILTFLYRAQNNAAATTGDMDKAISWAKEQGMIDEDFDPKALCTRADAVNYIWQAMGSEAPKTAADFTDIPDDADYAQAAAWAVERGITEGTGGNSFTPDKVCDRGTIATLLYRAYWPFARLASK